MHNNTQYIKDLLDKYFAAETSLEEEQKLSDYFNQDNIDNELSAYAPLFRQFLNEKQVKAPASTTNKLKRLQQKASRNRYIPYFGTAIAAGLLLLLTLTITNTADNNKNDNDLIVMYNNGKRVEDPVAALEFASEQFRKIGNTVNKANEIMNKPASTLKQSLTPIKKINEQLDKVEQKINAWRHVDIENINKKYRYIN